MVVSVAAHCAEAVGGGASCSLMTCSMHDRHLARSKASGRSGMLERTWSGLGLRVRVAG